MTLPPSSRLSLAPDLEICRILNGLWQVSGAHGPIVPRRAIAAMFAYLDAGFVTWDLADHYGPAEDFIGEFRRQLTDKRGRDAPDQIQALTKWVPRPGPMTREIVERNVDISLKRMDVDALDLLQFHWWDYSNPAYLDALHHLVDLQKAGKIRHLGLTNFDTERLALILDEGIPIRSNQVQFSLIDRRPLVRMVELCEARGVKLLAYGTLCGGLLSKQYLGKPEPHGNALNTASLRKYANMVDAWGGWQLFQELLEALQQIARQHRASIPNVAVRYVLDRPAVAGAIVGVRLGVSDRAAENARTFALKLDDGDRQRIDKVLAKSRDLFRLIGDCGDEYRR